MLLASGASAHPKLRTERSPGAAAFAAAVERVAVALTRDLARDGEGATKLVRVQVDGASNGAEAERVARRIANSALVKTALFGADANWGRILQTLGASRAKVDLAKTTVWLAGVAVFRGGASTGPAARRKAADRLRDADLTTELELAVDLGVGRSSYHVWTCDLTYDYVKINAEYTT